MVFYAVVGVGSALMPKRILPYGQVYPFFSFFLFPLTPNTVAKYAVRVLERNGQVLEPPRLLPEPESSNRGHVRIVQLHRIVQQLGDAQKRGDRDRVSTLRHLLERNYLSEGTRYELTRLVYNPLERWKTGACRVEPIETFRYEPAAR
jgi:hypothetical protein